MVRVSEPMGSNVFMINDVSGAFFEAPAIRNICVEILPMILRTQTVATIGLADSK